MRWQGLYRQMSPAFAAVFIQKKINLSYSTPPVPSINAKTIYGMKKNEPLPFLSKATSLLSNALHILIASVLMASCTTAAKEVNIGSKDIGGTVTGPNGQE